MEIAVCHGLHCGNGRCVAVGNHEAACVCDEKYHGEKCDQKLSEGGWIAAVAVLAVVVAVAAGVSIFFARRSVPFMPFLGKGPKITYF